jgi:hypothetical protein
MSIPFTYAGTLSYPMDMGIEPTSIPVNFAGNFDSESKATLKLVGTGTQVVDFGTILSTGAKVLQVEYDPDTSPAAQPIQLQFNGGGVPGQIELTPGGFLTFGSTAPTAAGILSLSIVHAANATVRVRILG